MICKALILKVASRCNLNCDYCYMYNLGDTSYQTQPRFMSDEVTDAIIEKVNIHCRINSLKKFEFIFHGGEPLLVSPKFYELFVRRAKTKLNPEVQVLFSLQTNGVLLSEQWVKLFEKLNINVSVSLDGPEDTHNLHRKDHRGNGSYQKVMQGLHTFRRINSKKKDVGTLSVIDITTNPIQHYQFLKENKIGITDFLLPDATFDSPPPHLGSDDDTPYANWLIRIFDEWFYDKQPKPSIRIFSQLIRLIIGFDEGFEYFGLRKNEFLVVETNGSIEVTGAFKICGNGFTKKGYFIQHNTFEEVFQDDFYKIYYHSHQNLCSECQHCEIAELCGGGFVAHRYKQQNGFDNPSVYCRDLMKLISHVQNVVLKFLPPDIVESSNLQPIIFEELIQSRQYINH